MRLSKEILILAAVCLGIYTVGQAAAQSEYPLVDGLPCNSACRSWLNLPPVAADQQNDASQEHQTEVPASALPAVPPLSVAATASDAKPPKTAPVPTVRPVSAPLPHRKVPMLQARKPALVNDETAVQALMSTIPRFKPAPVTAGITLSTVSGNSGQGTPGPAIVAVEDRSTRAPHLPEASGAVIRSDQIAMVTPPRLGTTPLDQGVGQTSVPSTTSVDPSRASNPEQGTSEDQQLANGSATLTTPSAVIAEDRITRVARPLERVAKPVTTDDIATATVAPSSSGQDDQAKREMPSHDAPSSLQVGQSKQVDQNASPADKSCPNKPLSSQPGYDLCQEANGTWSVYHAENGATVRIHGTPQVDLQQEFAARLTVILNGFKDGAGGAIE